MLYDQAFNNSFHSKVKSTQYNASLSITWAIRGTSYKQICQELDLDCFEFCRLYRKFCLFYKVSKNERPRYLLNLISVRSTPYATRTVGNILPVKKKLISYKNSSSRAAIIERYLLEPSLNTSKTATIFKKKIS